MGTRRPNTRRTTALLIGAGLIPALFVAAQPTSATVITVTTTADDLTVNGNCSLREAVQAANTDQVVDACPAGGVDDTVTLPAGTYLLTRVGVDDFNQVGSIDVYSTEVSDRVTIAGAGADQTIIDANGLVTGDAAFRLPFSIASVTFRDLTIRNGRNLETNGRGGAINNRFAESVALERVVLADNAAQTSGGAIGNPFNRVLTIRNSTLSGNRTLDAAAGTGGAIDNDGVLHLVNSTLSGNTSRTAGALFNSFAGTVELANVTITDNAATGLAVAGGLANETDGTITLTHTVLADNRDGSGGAVECSGVLTSQGHNLIGSTGGPCTFAAATGDLVGVEADLAPLALAGGTTPVHRPQDGSPAIDAGAAGGCFDLDGSPLATDQRGVPRPLDGGTGTARCDLGAVEVTAACTPGPTTLCINDQPGDHRFAATVAWNRTGAAGQAGAIALASVGVARGGLFWIGNASNPEVLLKVINGCAVNGHYWVFYSAGTNQGLLVTVLDTVTGTSWTDSNPNGTLAPPVADTVAFGCG